MLPSNEEVLGVLRQFNPWWSGRPVPDLPSWRRAVFRDLVSWTKDPPAGRALLLSGARQVGKTTLFLQTIDHLLAIGTPPTNILYATFDHPLLKLTGVEKILNLWRDFEAPKGSPEFLFLDEVQAIPDWQVWLKHQVDFHKKRRRIAITGSATPLVREGQESGVGRWETIQLPTLSFFEYLQLRKVSVPNLPEVPSLLPIFDWSDAERSRATHAARELQPHFNDYLLRGGFPQSVLVESVHLAQKLLREDIVEKVLKRDMTALFGTRRVLELEKLFLYLCLHDGGEFSITEVASNLGLNKPTVANFIDLFESAHLIYRLLPFGYGKQILRGRPKIYLADAAIAGSVMLKGKTLLEDTAALGRAVETAFFKHVFKRYYLRSVGFSYWRDKAGQEVDIIAELGDRLVPFEVKYRSQTSLGDFRGLIDFCAQRKVDRAYAITREATDFGILQPSSPKTSVRILKIPAPLACYWLGQSELSQTSEPTR